jgi:lipopolysaccharide transport system ATP-binding protein
MSADTVLYVTHLSKEYRLGSVNHAMLGHEIQAWWAKLRGRSNPRAPENTAILSDEMIGHAHAPPPPPPAPEPGPQKFLALDDVSFHVDRGDALGVIGSNGAGKSTLLKIISRVTLPTRGRVLYKGKMLSMLEIGTGFHPDLTGRENVYMNGLIIGMPKREIESKFDEIVEFSEIGRFIDTPVKRYSSGMHVRLAFSVAAHFEPEIIIVDEVLAVGDARFQKKCLNKMDSIVKRGTTILFVSHTMKSIRKLCNKCLVLDGGRVKYFGDVDEGVRLYEGPADESAAESPG